MPISPVSPASQKPIDLAILLRLMEELCAAFPDDPSAPGIMLSQVKSRRFYAAAVRFREPIGQGREVLATGRANDLPTAIRALAADWSKRRATILRTHEEEAAR